MQDTYRTASHIHTPVVINFSTHFKIWRTIRKRQRMTAQVIYMTYEAIRQNRMARQNYNDVTAEDISNALGFPVVTVQHHLNLLRKFEIIKKTPQYESVNYYALGNQKHLAF